MVSMEHRAFQILPLWAGKPRWLAPLLHLTVRSLGAALKEGGQRATAGSARHLLRRSLVVAEITLAVAVVVCAGLLIRLTVPER